MKERCPNCRELLVKDSPGCVAHIAGRHPLRRKWVKVPWRKELVAKMVCSNHRCDLENPVHKEVDHGLMPQV